MIFFLLTVLVPVVAAIFSSGDNRSICLIVLFWQIVGFLAGNTLASGFEYCLSASIDLIVVFFVNRYQTRTACNVLVVNSISVFNGFFGLVLFVIGSEPTIYEDIVLVLSLFQAIILVGGVDYERFESGVDDLLDYPDNSETLHYLEG